MNKETTVKLLYLGFVLKRLSLQNNATENLILVIHTQNRVNSILYLTIALLC